MNKLTIILATRNRPQLLIATVEQTLQNIREPDTRLVISADEDDEETLKVAFSDPRVLWSIEPRPGSLGAKYNRGMKVAPADVYLTMVDYAPHITEGFDTKILEAARVYPDGYAVILNHLANIHFSAINAVTAKLAVAMGGIYPEHFPYWFIDHWLEEMARRIGRRVFVDIHIDISQRPGTMNKKDPYKWGVRFGELEPERRAIADAIIDRPDFLETWPRKVALKRNYRLHDEWSAIINEMLRDQPSSPYSLYVATPMYGGQCYGPYAASMLTLASICAYRRIPFEFFGVLNESHIDRARNNCVDQFLRTTAFSHLMFIDADISFEPEDVFSLFKWDKDIICGFYPKKSINWKSVSEAARRGFADEDLAQFAGDMVFTPALNKEQADVPIDHPILLHEGGSGFMLIRREVFEKVKVPTYKKNGATGDDMRCYFDAKIDPSEQPFVRHLSEDYDFCRLAREAGIEIWLAPWIRLTHHGYHPFVGNVQAIAALQQAAVQCPSGLKPISAGTLSQGA